jgi:AcrR family transcriptional regulator
MAMLKRATRVTPMSGARREALTARLDRKRRDILNGATAVFRRRGYHGTSMDAITESTGISKPTLYRHFASKEELFKAIMQAEAERIGVRLEDGLHDTGSVEERLNRFARIYAQVVLEPDVMAMARIVIGLAHEMPELSHHYYDAAHHVTTDACLRLFERMRERGDLVIDDLELASEQFRALVLTSYYGPLLYRPTRKPSGRGLEYTIRRGVEVFLRAYGVPSPKRPGKG